MARIILVDDDKFVLKVLSKLIREKIGIETVLVMNFKELEKVLKENTYLIIYFVIIIFQMQNMEKPLIF